MATVVCQGLQSCLHESRTLRLKLSSSRSHFSNLLEFSLNPNSLLDSNSKEDVEGKRFHHEENTRKNSDNSTNLVEKGGWSFLQSLSIAHEKIEKETIYVHPMTKRSLYNLSEKSLELCTENLGNETGSDIVMPSHITSAGLRNWDVTDFVENVFSPLSSSLVTERRDELNKHHQLARVKKEKKARDIHFPPPLMTLSGPDALRVRSYHEDGRLVMKAVKVPSQGSIFHAKRKNGRLLLSISKDNLCDTQSHIGLDKSTSSHCFDLEVDEEDDGNDIVEVRVDHSKGQEGTTKVSMTKKE